MSFHRFFAAAVLVCVATGAASGCALLDNHRALTLELVVVEAEGDGPDVTTNPVDVTEQRCGERLDCVEAYSTDEADYYRFESRERAIEYGATVEDGFVVNYIVMDFAGKEASAERQRWAMEALAGTWQDYHGTFPER